MQFRQRPILCRLNPENVLQATGHEEVLLRQPQLLALVRFVIRIKNLRKVLRRYLVRHRSEKIAVVEDSEVEAVHRLRGPQTHRIRRVGAIAENRRIVRHPAHHTLRNPLHVHTPSRIRVRLGVPAHLHLERVFRPIQRPRISQPQPVVGRLHLPPVTDQLIENSVLITNAIADSGNVQGRQRIHEAGSQPSQTSIAQPRLCLLFDQHIQVKAQNPHRLLSLVINTQVDQVIRQMRPGQKLRGQITDHPHVLRHIVLRRGDPPLQQSIAHCMRQRHVQIVDRRALHRPALHKKQIIQKRLRQRVHSRRCPLAFQRCCRG